MFLNNCFDLTLWIKLANGIFFIFIESTDFVVFLKLQIQQNTIFHKFFQHYNLSPTWHTIDRVRQKCYLIAQG